MVVGEGFEPSKAEPADLQSAPFDHSGIQPRVFYISHRDTINYIKKYKFCQLFFFKILYRFDHFQ